MKHIRTICKVMKLHRQRVSFIWPGICNRDQISELIVMIDSLKSFWVLDFRMQSRNVYYQSHVKSYITMMMKEFMDLPALIHCCDISMATYFLGFWIRQTLSGDPKIGRCFGFCLAKRRLQDKTFLNSPVIEFFSLSQKQEEASSLWLY